MNGQQINDLTRSLDVIDFDAPAAEYFGRSRVRFKREGVVIASPI